MQEMLGPHPNSHVVYPMPGRHRMPEKTLPLQSKFRLVYVGSVQNFYGRMLCSLIEKIETTNDLEIIVVGPNADWPKPLVERACAQGSISASSRRTRLRWCWRVPTRCWSVTSFEKQHELFMRTSFTTKFLDYVVFAKPVILWGPEDCTPVLVAREHGGAAVVTTEDPGAVVSALPSNRRQIPLNEELSKEALRLRQTLFNPDRLQAIFVDEIERLVTTGATPMKSVCLAILNYNGRSIWSICCPALAQPRRISPERAPLSSLIIKAPTTI